MCACQHHAFLCFVLWHKSKNSTMQNESSFGSVCKGGWVIFLNMWMCAHVWVLPVIEIDIRLNVYANVCVCVSECFTFLFRLVLNECLPQVNSMNKCACTCAYVCVCASLNVSEWEHMFCESSGWVRLKSYLTFFQTFNVIFRRAKVTTWTWNKLNLCAFGPVWIRLQNSYLYSPVGIQIWIL